MKLLFSVSLVMFAFIASSAFSGDAPAPTKSAHLEEKVNKLSAKLDEMEKRFATLEAENRELRAALSQLQFQLSYAPPLQNLDAPAVHLLPSTELHGLFTVERTFIGEVHPPDNRLEIGDAYRPDYRLDLIAPHQDREFKVDLDSIVLPEQK